MRKHRLLAFVAMGFWLPLAGCGRAHSDAAATAATPQDGEAAVSPRNALSVESRLRGIAGRLRHDEYTVVGGWNRAIGQCASWESNLGLSDGGAAAPHGMKIYQTWAKDAEAYLLAGSKDQSVGQVIVKESWTPREVAQIAVDEAAGFYAKRDGKHYKPDRPKELFIMFKDDPATPNTDEGWSMES